SPLPSKSRTVQRMKRSLTSSQLLQPLAATGGTGSIAAAGLSSSLGFQRRPMAPQRGCRDLSVGSDVSTDCEPLGKEKRTSDYSTGSSSSSGCESLTTLPPRADAVSAAIADLQHVAENTALAYDQAGKLSLPLAARFDSQTLPPSRVQVRPQLMPMKMIDDCTEVPEDLFNSLLLQAKKVRSCGQHAALPRQKGSRAGARLVHQDVLNRRASKMQLSGAVGFETVF
ncbi:unnamed protein product, partial [Polarella glacialis]